MENRSSQPHANTKYLFDLNKFDQDPDFDPNNPPAPVFSEDDLKATREKAFSEGRQKGLDEAKESRDQQVAGIVTKIETGITTLISAERTREKRFEEETLALATALFRQAFPILNEAHGLQQIRETIQGILSGLEDPSSVLIETAPNDLDDLSDRLRPLLNRHEHLVSIQTAPELSPGSFRLKWKDGGALRDTQALTDRIVRALAATLAETRQKPQDKPTSS